MLPTKEFFTLLIDRLNFGDYDVIDSAFSNPKFRIRRVKRWWKSNKMTKRWAGSNLLEQEKTFQKVNACQMNEEFLKVYLSLDQK